VGHYVVKDLGEDGVRRRASYLTGTGLWYARDVAIDKAARNPNRYYAVEEDKYGGNRMFTVRLQIIEGG
jgi:hypothetical protein